MDIQEAQDTPTVQPEVLNSSELAPVTVQTDKIKQDQKAALKAEEDKTSYLDLLSKAREVDAVGPALGRVFGGEAFPADPAFHHTEESWAKLTDGIEPDNVERLIGPLSQAEAEHVRRRILVEQEAKGTLNKSGWTGVSAHLLATMFDETALAAVVASEGLATPWVMASKLGKLGRIGRSMLVGSAVDTGLQTGVYGGNETDQASSVLLAGALGSVMGPLSYKGLLRGFNVENTSGDALRTIADSIERGPVLADSVGARRATGAPALPFNTDTHAEIAAMDDFKPLLHNIPFIGKFLEGTRFSLAATMKRSENKVSRWVSDNFLENGVEGGKVSAALIQHTEYGQFMGAYARVRNDSFKAWKKENWETTNPFRVFSDARARTEFFSRVDAAKRGTKDASAHVNRVAAHMSVDSNRMLRMLKAEGVEGFEEIPENGAYMMRLWDSDAFGRFNAKFGKVPTVGLIAGAIRKSVPDVDEALTDKVAEAIFDRFHRGIAGSVGSPQRLFGGKNLDDIEEFMKDLDVAPNELGHIDEFMKQLRRQELTDKSGKPARSKRRVLLDEGHSDVLLDRAGDAHNVKLSDLFSTDADVLHTSYLRQMTGRYALAKKGIKSDADWNMVGKRLADEGSEQSHNKARVKSELENLKFIHDNLLGRPTGDDHTGLGSNLLRLVRDSNFIRVMNQSGFAQLPEFASIVAQTGFRNSLAYMPELRSIYRQLKDGSMTSEHPLFHEIESTIGSFGDNRALHQPHARHDELGHGGNFGDHWFSPVLERIDTAQQYGKKITGDISGMAPLTSVLEKLAAVSMSQKFLSMARKPSTANLKRMKTLGLSDTMLDNVLKQIAAHAGDKPSFIAGRKLDTMNFHRWDDPDAFEAYRYAINRWGARLVQQNLLGESHPLMSTAWGKTLFQFRSFVLGGHEKQLLHNIAMADKESLTYAMAGTFIGGLSYMLQTSVNSVGRADAEQYRKERLSVKAVGTAAFAKSGMSTLIPGTVDTLLMMTGRDQVFSHARSTQQDANFVTGNPTVSAFIKAQGVGKAIGGLTNPDYTFSKQDMNNITGLTWFSNAVGLRNLFEIMQHDLPKRSLQE